MRFLSKQYLNALYPSVHVKFAILIVVLAALSYWTILPNGFTYDDHVLIEGNPHIKSLNGIYHITFERVKAEEAEHSDEAALRSWTYRPCSFFIFYLIGKIFSINPFPFHLFNLIFHCINSVLIYVLCLRLFFSVRSTLFASLIFAVHPIHTDAVASAMSLPDEFVVFFGILSFLFLISEMKGNYAIAFVLFFAALLSKDNAVALVAVYVGLIVYLRMISRIELHKDRLLSIAVILLVPLIMYFFMRFNVTGSFLRNLFVEQLYIDNPLLQATHMQRLLTGIYILWRYMILFFYPVNLSADYSLGSIAPLASALDPRFIISLISLLIVLMIFIVLIIKKRRIEALGIYLFFACLLPVSNLLFAGATMMAERYLYLPSIGLCMLVGNIIGTYTESREKTVKIMAYAVASILIAVMTVKCMARNRVWKNDATLFYSVIQVYPDNVKALNNLAVINYRNGDSDSAVQFYERIIQNYPELYPPYLSIILTYYQMNSMDKAIQYCQKAIRVFPQKEYLYDLLANIYLKTGDYNQAMIACKEGVKQIALSSLLHYRVGLLYFKANDCQSAKEYFMNSLNIRDTVEPHYFLAKCYYGENKKIEALAEFKKSLSIHGMFPDILKYLVLLNIEFHYYPDAEKAAMMYVQEFYQNADAYAVAALYYLQVLHDSNAAHDYMQKALSLDPRICLNPEYTILCK